MTDFRFTVGLAAITAAKWLVGLAVLVALLWGASVLAVRAGHSEEHNYLLSWIPSHCCVTNNCCFSIRADAIRAAGNDEYEILASGQVLKRTEWSPDGKTWRCACDYFNGKWTVFDKAKTRCIFPPMQTTNKSVKGM